MKKIDYYSCLKRIFAALLQMMRTILRLPFRLLLAVYSILSSLVCFFAEMPAEIISITAEHIAGRAGQIDSSLRSSTQKRAERQLRITMGCLLNGRDFIHVYRYNACIRLGLTAILQFVSLFTTLRGLYQCFSSLSALIPCLLSLGIQIGLFYMSAVVVQPYMPKGKWFVTIFLLCSSIVFSYVGVSESLAPYEDYVEQVYTDYIDSYSGAVSQTLTSVNQGISPDQTVEALYLDLNRICDAAEEYYGDKALAEANATLNRYLSRHNSSTITQENSVTVTRSNDPSAVSLISNAQSAVDHIKMYRKSYDELRTQLKSNDCTPEQVCSAVARCLSEHMTDSEAQRLFSTVDDMIVTANTLAVDMGHSTITLQMGALLHDSRTAHMLSALVAPLDFAELRALWRNEEITLDSTGFHTLDKLLAEATRAVPSRLKSLADEQISLSYREIRKVEFPNGTFPTQLENVRAAYGLMPPMAYSFSLLLPKNCKLGTSLLAVGVAILNDLMTLLIGVFLSRRSMNFKRRDCSTDDFINHMYEQLESVMTLLIIERLKAQNIPCTAESMTDAFVSILSDYLRQFRLCPKLIEKGYSRYCHGLPDATYDALTSLLLSIDMVHCVTAEEFQEMGFTPSAPDVTEYLLLSGRGDAWLKDLCGTSESIRCSSRISYV